MGGGHTVIGVDVGGTKTVAALVRERVEPGASGVVAGSPVPEVLDRRTAATDQSSPEACLRGIARCIAGLEHGAARAEAVGVGVASMVDFAGGRIVESVNLPLRDVPLRRLLQERFGVPAVVDNDATAAAVGEHAYGAGRGTSDMLMLTLGTGVGGGIICGGRPYRGRSGAAGELGHVTIDENGPECPAACPGRGCLEAYASGTAMTAAAEAEARAKPASALGRALRAGQVVDSRLLTGLALDGDGDAAAVLARVGERLGVGLASLVNVFNPELVVVGGGASAAGDLLLAPARRVVAARALRPQRDEVRIVTAGLGADAGWLGAAALALASLRPS